MQGLADGYFVLPYTVQNYLSAEIKTPRIPTDSKEFAEAEKRVKERLDKLMSIAGLNPLIISTRNLARSCGRMWVWAVEKKASKKRSSSSATCVKNSGMIYVSRGIRRYECRT